MSVRLSFLKKKKEKEKLEKRRRSASSSHDKSIVEYDKLKMNVVSMVQSTCLRDLSLRKYSRSSGASGRNTRRQSFAAAAALKTTTGSCWTCAPDFVLDQNKLTLVQRLSRGLCTSTLALALALAPVPTTDSSVQALGPVKVELSDVHIEKLECEGMAGPGGAVSPDDDTGTGCYKVTAQATNPGKELFNADVFGFIYDQYDNPGTFTRSLDK